jgi:lipoate-protein ligase B
MALNGVPIYHVERGGEVTFHGPGQLVVYPLLDLRRPPYKQDLHWYLQMVEEVVIQTLLAYDIKGNCNDINTGVWVGKEKVMMDHYSWVCAQCQS